MKKLLFLFSGLISIIAYGSKFNQCVAQEPEQVPTQTYQEPETEVADDTTEGIALNDIRFAGWTKKEWADNDYIRAVREFIDAYNNGEIEYPYLDEYKHVYDVGDLGLIPGSGRFPGEGNGNPLQDSSLENSLDCGA